MKKYTWESEGNTETWIYDTFDTVQECIQDAVENGCRKGDIIYIGETLPFNINIDATDVLERLEEEAYDFAGDSAEDWDSFDYKNGKEELDELSEQLSNVIENWLKKHNRMPYFYQIINVRGVEI